MSATVIAATAAGSSSRAAEVPVNYNTFTQARPKVSSKRKPVPLSPAVSPLSSPLPSPPLSVGSNSSVYRGKSIIRLLGSDSSPSVSSDGPSPDGPDLGCWATVKHWLNYLNPWF